MTLAGHCSADVKTSGGAGGGGALTVVGVKMDSRSKELLTWALVKIAQPGDRVIALHVLNPNTEDESELLSMVKTFDSVLAAFEGFCSLKQVDLKLKVCRGSPNRVILAREAKNCRATNLVVGTSYTHHTILSSVAVAKYCSRNVGKGISVIAVDDGKIVFQRAARASFCQTCHYDVPEARSNSLALVTVKSMDMPAPKRGWSLLRRVHLQNHNNSRKSSAKRPSFMQQVINPQNGQSFAAIYPDHKQSKCEDKRNNGAIVPTSNENNCPSILKELEGLSRKYSSVYRLFSYQELLTATANFAPENLIGKGGSSIVYKGCLLPHGNQVAVKSLKQSETMVTQFCSEIEILATLHHKNIIFLLGFCFEQSNLLLVYNLLSRGSLEDNLHAIRRLPGTQNGGNAFDWQGRYKVALGIAEALDHLHTLPSKPVIHRDVKSSNILLSDDFEPQLSDFGLTTPLSSSSSSCRLDGIDVAGTFGYLAPEYFTHGKISEKMDVYSFGVVLLELLSGRKPIDNRNTKGHTSLVLWAEEILRDGKPTSLLDVTLIETYDHDQFERITLAAQLCINREPLFRPTMNHVVRLLRGEPDAMNLARQHVNGLEELGGEKHGKNNIQSLINLALLNLADDNIQNISVESYLQGRLSCCSSSFG
ncbi:unnamed protein product [Cuscuta campestris]|uniref:Protein kinase domain-containing protein n=1 Tax=Cuscuta campestris TaxID=132261 RepID=A0A484K654_9ASTE|nr:unnamed protein product [Cuscuta campestris]